MPFEKFSIHPTSQPLQVDVVGLTALFSFSFSTFLGNLKIAGMFSFILMGTAMHNSLCFHANSFS